MASISVTEFTQANRQPGRFHLVDVRSPSEYATGHIPGAINIAMEEVESRIADLDLTGRIVLVCQSGRRARIVAGLLEPCGKDCVTLEGGTDAWIKAGLPTVASVRSRWSLERQVRLGAGLMVLTGVTLALTTNIGWLSLSAFAGLGLSFSGLTGFCPMASFLALLPWNQSRYCNVEVHKIDDDKCTS